MKVEHRFIITGMGRSASKWLAFMLNRHPKGEVVHEYCKGPGFYEDLGHWLKRENAPVSGMVNGHVRELIVRVDEFCNHPQWVTIWRDPGDLTASIWQRRVGGGKNWSMEYATLENIAQNLAANLEHSFSLFALCGIRPSLWHMDYYTTREGFNRLARHVKLPFKPPINISKIKEGEVRVICKGGMLKTMERDKDGKIDPTKNPKPPWIGDKAKANEIFDKYPIVGRVYRKLAEKGYYIQETEGEIENVRLA